MGRKRSLSPDSLDKESQSTSTKKTKQGDIPVTKPEDKPTDQQDVMVGKTQNESEAGMDLSRDKVKEVSPEKDKEVLSGRDNEVSLSPKKAKEVLPEKDKEVSPMKDKDVLPEQDKEVSSKKDKKDSPKKDKKITPKKDRKVSPKKDKECTPKKDKKVSPKKGKGDSSTKSKKVSPKKHKDSSPKKPKGDATKKNKVSPKKSKGGTPKKIKDTSPKKNKDGSPKKTRKSISTVSPKTNKGDPVKKSKGELQKKKTKESPKKIKTPSLKKDKGDSKKSKTNSLKKIKSNSLKKNKADVSKKKYKRDSPKQNGKGSPVKRSKKDSLSDQIDSNENKLETTLEGVMSAEEQIKREKSSPTPDTKDDCKPPTPIKVPRANSSRRDKNYPCNLCKKRKFDRLARLMQHQRRCSEQDMMFNDILHQLKQKTLRVAARVCFTCKQSFHNASHLRRHNRGVHGDAYYEEEMRKGSKAFHTGQPKVRRKYLCKICGMNCHRKDRVLSHEAKCSRKGTLVSDLSKGLICQICRKTFTSSTHRRRHEESVHSNVRLFMCRTCNKSFKDPDTLKNHQIRHTGVKSFQCRFCEMKFYKTNDMKKHERVHTGEKPYKCRQCDKEFARGDARNEHEKTHLNVKFYKCDHCNKSYTQESYLIIHTMRVHTGEKPFRCDICDMAFVTKNSCKTHWRKHEKPRCKICQRFFASTSSLSNHMWNKHRIAAVDTGKVCKTEGGRLEAMKKENAGSVELSDGVKESCAAGVTEERVIGALVSAVIGGEVKSPSTETEGTIDKTGTIITASVTGATNQGVETTGDIGCDKSGINSATSNDAIKSAESIVNGVPKDISGGKIAEVEEIITDDHQSVESIMVSDNGTEDSMDYAPMSDGADDEMSEVEAEDKGVQIGIGCDDEEDAYSSTDDESTGGESSVFDDDSQPPTSCTDDSTDEDDQDRDSTVVMNESSHERIERLGKDGALLQFRDVDAGMRQRDVASMSNYDNFDVPTEVLIDYSDREPEPPGIEQEQQECQACVDEECLACVNESKSKPRVKSKVMKYIKSIAKNLTADDPKLRSDLQLSTDDDSVATTDKEEDASVDDDVEYEEGEEAIDDLLIDDDMIMAEFSPVVDQDDENDDCERCREESCEKCRVEESCSGDISGNDESECQDDVDGNECLDGGINGEGGENLEKMEERDEAAVECDKRCKKWLQTCKGDCESNAVHCDDVLKDCKESKGGCDKMGDDATFGNHGEDYADAGGVDDDNDTTKKKVEYYLETIINKNINANHKIGLDKNGSEDGNEKNVSRENGGDRGDENCDEKGGNGAETNRESVANGDANDEMKDDCVDATKKDGQGVDDETLEETKAAGFDDEENRSDHYREPELQHDSPVIDTRPICSREDPTVQHVSIDHNTEPDCQNDSPVIDTRPICSQEDPTEHHVSNDHNSEPDCRHDSPIIDTRPICSPEDPIEHRVSNDHNTKPDCRHDSPVTDTRPICSQEDPTEHHVSNEVPHHATSHLGVYDDNPYGLYQNPAYMYDGNGDMLNEQTSSERQSFFENFANDLRMLIESDSEDEKDKEDCMVPEAVNTLITEDIDSMDVNDTLTPDGASVKDQSTLEVKGQSSKGSVLLSTPDVQCQPGEGSVLLLCPTCGMEYRDAKTHEVVDGCKSIDFSSFDEVSSDFLKTTELQKQFNPREVFEKSREVEGVDATNTATRDNVVKQTHLGTFANNHLFGKGLDTIDASKSHAALPSTESPEVHKNHSTSNHASSIESYSGSVESPPRHTTLDKTSVTPRSLKNSRRSSNGKICCKYCNVAIQKKERLDAHEIKCLELKRLFEYLEKNPEIYRKRRREMKSFSCHHCLKNCKSKVRYEQHLRLCQQRKRRLSQVKQGIERVPEFRCTYCSRLFNVHKEWETHVKECEHLEKQYEELMQTSPIAPRFVCCHCKKGFNKKLNCSRHEGVCARQDKVPKKRGRKRKQLTQPVLPVETSPGQSSMTSLKKPSIPQPKLSTECQTCVTLDNPEELRQHKAMCANHKKLLVSPNSGRSLKRLSMDLEFEFSPLDLDSKRPSLRSTQPKPPSSASDDALSVSSSPKKVKRPQANGMTPKRKNMEVNSVTPEPKITKANSVTPKHKLIKKHRKPKGLDLQELKQGSSSSSSSKPNPPVDPQPGSSQPSTPVRPQQESATKPQPNSPVRKLAGSPSKMSALQIKHQQLKKKSIQQQQQMQSNSNGPKIFYRCRYCNDKYRNIEKLIIHERRCLFVFDYSELPKQLRTNLGMF